MALRRARVSAIREVLFGMARIVILLELGPMLRDLPKSRHAIPKISVQPQASFMDGAMFSSFAKPQRWVPGWNRLGTEFAPTSFSLGGD